MRTRWVLIVEPTLVFIFWLQMLHAISYANEAWAGPTQSLQKLGALSTH